MVTEEAGSNPGALAAQRPLQELFPVRRVLGMLQRNECLSEQPTQPALAPAKQLNDQHQENQDGNSQEIVSESPSSQQDGASQESISGDGEGANILSCPKCGKGFSSGTSLRTHLANVYPCDQSRPVILPREVRLESKTCFKCGKTFASWQGLRGHLNRIKPCDQEKPATTSTRRRPAASRTCGKCGKTFSSPQSLRIHMNRVKPCVLDDTSMSAPTTPPATMTPTTSLMMNTENLRKEADRKAKARYQARKAYLKKRGRLDELGDPPSPYYQSGDDQKETEMAAVRLGIKRSTPEPLHEESDNSESPNTEAKKPRMEEERPHDDEPADSPSDVSVLPTQPIVPTPTTPQRKTATPLQPKLTKKTVTGEGSFVHRSRSNKDHSGDLLAGGCSCPPCVRRWARKLMNRMQQLEDEVVMLRQKKSADRANATGAASTNAPNPTSQMKSDKRTQSQAVELSRSLPVQNSGALSSSNVVVASLSQTKPVDISQSMISSSKAVATLQRPEGGVSDGVGKTYPTILPRTDGLSPRNEARHDNISRADEQQQQQQQSATATVLHGLGSDKRSLMDAYSHMNDQIFINERTVEESSGHAQILMGYNPEFRRQVDELRESIIAEKSKRDIAVATLIAHEWKPRQDEFRAVLERTGPVKSSSNEDQTYHAKWAEIANQVSVKDKVMAELERRMDSLGQSSGSSRSRYAEMGELTSKMAAEYAAKIALESEREAVYLGLVKSSPRVRLLVRNALLK